MNFNGLVVGFFSFLIIGLFHPLVVKAEYFWGKKSWTLFLILGLAAAGGSLFIENQLFSIILAVFGFASFWSIHEIFEQVRRVEKGWFPLNPKQDRKKQDVNKN